MAFQTVKVTILPTNEVKGDFSKERIYPCLLKYSWMFDKEEKGKLIYSDSNIKTPTQLQHLYIISDDEIKLFDCVYNNKENIVEQINSKTQLIFVLEENKENQTFKKIIATTDTSLLIDTYINQGDTVKGDLIIKRGSDYTTGLKGRINLPQPSQQFIQKYIEEYNKGNVITDVLVEYIPDFNSCFCTKDICNGNNCPKKLKVKDNTITIKKIKDNYTKEELCQILEKYTSFLWNEVGIHYPISLGNDAKDKFINREL